MTTFRELRDNWQSLGSDDPLWAILSDPRTKGGKWSVREFLRTGEMEVDRIFSWLDEQGLTALHHGHALDFGCGAGRLTQALAKRFDLCTGVDVAASMLEAARKLDPPQNCEFVLNERSDLSVFADGSFNFIYSSIVLQHIPHPFAIGYIAEFCRLLAPDGLLVFQIAIDKQVPPGHWLIDLKQQIAARVALRTRVRRMLGHPVPRPAARIEMHVVPAATVEQQLKRGGVDLKATGYTNSCDTAFNGNLQISKEPRYYQYLLSGLFAGVKAR
ncbi:MAG: methyltransferase domain-containing protein [Chthoniobacterales bacterium]